MTFCRGVAGMCGCRNDGSGFVYSGPTDKVVGIMTRGLLVSGLLVGALLVGALLGSRGEVR
mgnify:CR=1 FL=1